jgi:transcription elongation factor GreA
VESSGTGIVEIGSHVTVTDGKNNFEYSVVGGYESDPAQKTISHISPLGRALMGKKKEDEVVVHAPSGPKTYTIVEIL